MATPIPSRLVSEFSSLILHSQLGYSTVFMVFYMEAALHHFPSVGLVHCRGHGFTRGLPSFIPKDLGSNPKTADYHELKDDS